MLFSGGENEEIEKFVEVGKRYGGGFELIVVIVIIIAIMIFIIIVIMI